MAYGDALGKPTEFMTVEEIDRAYSPIGPRDVAGDPALVTDDTRMALAVAWAPHGADGFSAEVLEPRLRERFVAWAMNPENNRAPGMTCLRAVAGLAEDRPWTEATMRGSKGCGANMRVTPVGLLPGLDLDTLAAVSQLQAAMTHGHPTALAASELTAYATQLLVDGLPPAELVALLRERCVSVSARFTARTGSARSRSSRARPTSATTSAAAGTSAPPSSTVQLPAAHG